MESGTSTRNAEGGRERRWRAPAVRPQHVEVCVEKSARRVVLEDWQTARATRMVNRPRKAPGGAVARGRPCSVPRLRRGESEGW